MKTINKYTIVARPDVRRAIHRTPMGEPRLTKSLVEQAVPGAVVLSIDKEYGDRTIEVRLKRTTHPEALAVLVPVIEQLGFSVIISPIVSEIVSEVMDQAVKMGVVGVFGEALAENPAVLLLADAAGAIAGHWANKQVERVEAEFVGTRDGTGGWSVHRLSGGQTATLSTARSPADPIAVRAGQFGEPRVSATLTPNWSGSLPRHSRRRF